MNRQRPDGLSFYCKHCLRARDAEAYRRRRTALGQSVRERAEHGPDEKQCADCRQVKPLTEFPVQRKQAGGYNCYCKLCHNERQRAMRFERLYGLTLQQRDALIEEQGGRCAVCRSGPAEHIDHDHRTGVIRGMLCFSCNAGIGQFKDDPRLLIAAVHYLERTSCRVT